MKRAFLILWIFCSLMLAVPTAFAEKDIGEGYAPVNFKELIQTITMLGGLDINNRDVTDEYARLMYCDIYKKNFDNDIEWNKIRQQVIFRQTEKKEYYRVLYETTGLF